MGWTRRRSNGREYAQQITHRKPVARSEDLVVEELGDELLIYDLINSRAHSLGAPAAKVWRACDGGTTVEALGTELQLDDETVTRALLALDECELLEPEAATGNGMTRRDMTVRVAKLSAAAAAVPLVMSVAAPVAQAAVTEAFCQGITTSEKGCGDCHKKGCCCCFPPGGDLPAGSKPCHASCDPTITECNPSVGNNCNGSSDNCKNKT